MRRGPSLMAGMALAAAGFVNAAPVVPVHALACPAGANLKVTPGAPASIPTAIDPQATINSLIVLGSSSPRPYATIADGNFYRNQTVLGFGGTYTKVCIDTVGPQPATWPATPSGDLGVQFEGCADASQDSGFIGKDAVVAATNGGGGPIYDGPYSPDQDWKACGIATFGDGETGTGPLDSGFVWQHDPDDSSSGTAVFLDHNNGLVLPPASWVGTQVTLYIPDTLQYVLPATPISPPTPVIEKLFNPADATEATNAIVESLAETAVNLPAPVCPSGIVPGTGDCLQSLLRFGLLVHWAPGQQLGIPADHLAGIDLGLVPVPPGANTIPACVDPDGVPLADEPGNPPFDTIPGGGSNVLPPPYNGACVLFVGASLSGVSTYESHTGQLSGHDFPCIPAGTLPGQSACDHLTRVWDYTRNGF